MKPIDLNLVRAFVNKEDLGNTFINPDPSFEDTVLLTDTSDNKYYLPRYENATQVAGGQEQYTPILAADGKLTFYFKTAAPSEIAGQIDGASPCNFNLETSVFLAYQESGDNLQEPLALSDEGNNIWTATADLSASEQQQIRNILLNTTPTANIKIVRKVTLAGRLTKKLVVNNWPILKDFITEKLGLNSSIHPGNIYELVVKFYPDLTQQYVILDCIYKNQIGVPSLPGYIQRQVMWKDRIYSYYQDNQQLNRVFYLPSRFQLAQQSDGDPTVSLLEFSTSNGSAQNIKATFRFFAQSLVEQQRIDNAASELEKQIGQTIQMVSLEDAQGISTQLTLFLPNTDGTASVARVRKNAKIDLSRGITDELSLNFKAFQALWDAIFSTAPEQRIFTGYVDVTINSGKNSERVDFDGRITASDEAHYFDLIIDEGIDNTYSKTLNIETFSQVFQDEVVALALDFGENTVSLKANKLQGTVEVQRPIRNIVLGRENPGLYTYTLKVIRVSEASCCSKETSSEDVYILQNDVKNCKGTCDT